VRCQKEKWVAAEEKIDRASHSQPGYQPQARLKQFLDEEVMFEFSF
jgi:hypothetical protein